MDDDCSSFVFFPLLLCIRSLQTSVCCCSYCCKCCSPSVIVETLFSQVFSCHVNSPSLHEELCAAEAYNQRRVAFGGISFSCSFFLFLFLLELCIAVLVLSATLLFLFPHFVRFCCSLKSTRHEKQTQGRGGGLYAEEEEEEAGWYAYVGF